MKQATHPTYFPEARIVCVCGNRFTVGSTQEEIHVELCYKCHPFYTGEQKFVDSASRIQKFQQKQEKAKEFTQYRVKKQEEIKRRQDAPKTLREMLSALK